MAGACVWCAAVALGAGCGSPIDAFADGYLDVSLSSVDGVDQTAVHLVALQERGCPRIDETVTATFDGREVASAPALGGATGGFFSGCGPPTFVFSAGDPAERHEVVVEDGQRRFRAVVDNYVFGAASAEITVCDGVAKCGFNWALNCDGVGYISGVCEGTIDAPDECCTCVFRAQIECTDVAGP